MDNLPKNVEIDGIKFQLEPLPVVESLRGLDLLAEKIVPVFGIIFGGVRITDQGIQLSGDLNEEGLARQVAQLCSSLPELFELFAKRSKWQKPPANAYQSVWDFQEVFARKPARTLAWLTECILVEYADFFTEDGRNLIGTTVNGLISRLGSIGGSGES